MQILHLQTELQLSCGVTRVIFQLMKNATADSAHFVLTFGGNAVYKFKKERLSVQLIPRSIKYAAFPWHVYAIYQFCKANNISVIHAHHRYFDLAASIAARFLGIPVITSVHSKVSSKKFLSYRADHFIAVSATIKNHLEKTFGIDPLNITLINNFIDELGFDTETHEEEGLKADLGIFGNRTIIAFIGRFSKEKGIDTLMQAFRKLQYEYVDLTLLLIGDGEEKRNIVNLVQAKFKDVKIIEAQEDIAPYYQIADIVVLPSRVDPYPLVMLECGYMQKALIASKVDGIAEFIKDGINGVLVEPGNSEDLIVGFRRLLDNAAFRFEIGEHLHRKVMETSLKRHILPKYYSLYATVKK